MRRRTIVLSLLLVLVMGVLPQIAGAAIEPGEEFPVSLEGYGQTQPDIDYPWIVWKTETATTRDYTDIYAYNFETGEEVPVCTEPGQQANPSISGDWVVYSDDRVGDDSCDTYAYNLVTEEERLLASNFEVDQGNPAIDGDIVVHNFWDNNDPDHYGDIWAYDLATDDRWAVCQDPGTQREPEIGDGWIVWKDDSTYDRVSIIGYDMEAEEQVTIAEGYYVDTDDWAEYTDASTDDGLVVAEKYGYFDGEDTTFDYAIVLIDTETLEETVISTVIDDNGRYHPVINDGLVTWHDARSGNYEVYCYDIATGEETCLVPARPNPDVEEWIYAGRTTTADGIVAWHDHRTEVDEFGEPIEQVYTNEDLYAMYVYGDATEMPLAGPNRYATAVEVSQDTFPEGAETVIIATGLNFPDALAGASLAGAYGAPILLVNNGLPGEVEAEIDRLGATDCIILGSEAAVSGAVEDALAALGLDITRIGGADRFETAAMIAEETIAVLGEDWDGSAFLVTGYNFPDALSAGPLSSYAGYPVFLGSKDGVSDATLATMNELGVTQVYIIGGPTVINLDADAGISAQAIAGDDRYETAAQVFRFGVEEMGLSASDLALATGATFPDALTAGAAQGITGGSLLITPPTSLHPAVADALEANVTRIRTVKFIGSTAALSQFVRDQVMAILTPAG